MRMMGMGSLLGIPVVLLVIFILLPLLFGTMANLVLLFLQAAWPFIVGAVLLYCLLLAVVKWARRS